MKSDLRVIPSFESILKSHRPNDIGVKYTTIINEDIQVYLYEKATTFYQIIYNPETFDFVTISRGIILNKSNSKVCTLSMVHTNSSYRNQQFCQKNISLLVKNINKTVKSLNKFVLSVEINNIPAVKCYKNCGFVIIKTQKKIYYLMELDN